MDLPIDFTKRPFREKYIDEETPLFARWFEFGRQSNDLLTLVDIADHNGDVLINVPLAKANEIMRARNEFINILLRVLNEP